MLEQPEFHSHRLAPSLQLSCDLLTVKELQGLSELRAQGVCVSAFCLSGSLCHHLTAPFHGKEACDIN